MLDEDLLNLANGEDRILITNDKDFGELVFLQKKLSTGIILFRIKGQSAQIKVDRVRSLLDRYPDKIVNHFVVITNDKIRFVPLESIK